MNEYRNKPRDCTPTDNPSPQPKPPVDDSNKCNLPDPTPPPKPPEPEPCPAPPPECKCPPSPTTTKNCLEKAIDNVSKQIVQGDRASKFKDELNNRLTAATKAAQDYTQAAYEQL